MEQLDQSTHERILNAAEKLFAEKGYKETTTREIVREAGASLSSLQTHFQGKENVFAEVRSRAIARFHQLMKPSLDEVRYVDSHGLLYGERAWNLLSEIVSKYAEWVFDPRNRHTIMLINHELLTGDPSCFFFEGPTLDISSAVQLLCERYSGITDGGWSGLIGQIPFTTMFGLSGFAWHVERSEKIRNEFPGSAQEVKYRVKGYILLTLRSYLDIRREHPPAVMAESGPVQLNQDE